MKIVLCCKEVAIASVIGLMAGCSTPYTADIAKRVESKQVVDYSYSVGDSRIVKIGDPVIKVKDLRILVTSSQWATPDRTITIQAGDADITLEQGTQYLIAGTTILDGKRYWIVQTPFGIPMGSSWVVLIDEDGGLYPRIAGVVVGLVFNAREHVISDPEVRFIRGQIETVDRSAPYKNFELIYGGRSSSVLSMTYREFGADNPNVVSYFQDLIYDVDAEEIAFRNFRIRIDNVASDAIHVTVLED